MSSFYRLKARLRRLSPARLLTLGFLSVILAGTLLLWLPVSHQPGKTVSLVDALFVSTSAVCVTGLTTVTIGTTFNTFGKVILAILIQIGGLGVVSMSVTFILLIGGRISMKVRQLMASAMNLTGYAGIVSVLKRLLLITLGFEVAGAAASFFVFVQDYPPALALGYAVFHSISAFNNAGFDILNTSESLLQYAGNVPMNLITTALVISGGFGFYAIIDMWHQKYQWKKFSLNTKIILIMTVFLLSSGTLLLKWTTPQTWMEAWFQSVIARTAGFNTHPLSDYTPAAIVVFCFLMFVGANPGGTGGGIKTTTLFAVAFKAVSSTTNDNRDEIFYRKIPNLIFTQALTVFFFGLSVVLIGTVLILWLEPGMDLTAVLVEVTSAFATVGSTVGVTPMFSTASKFILMVCMFIGRLGPVTIANNLVFKGHNNVRFTEENILIG